MSWVSGYMLVLIISVFACVGVCVWVGGVCVWVGGVCVWRKMCLQYVYLGDGVCW